MGRPASRIGAVQRLADTVPGVSASVEIRRVSKSFGALRALDDVDLTIEPGEIVTLLGPSGCGKTTLLRLIAGLLDPTSGSITIDGASPRRARSSKRVGFVPQAPALLPWRTVRANARVLLDLNAVSSRARSSTRSSSVDELLDAVGLADFADAHPHELSGGMQQRVGLVRAFALDAPLLLMDEPFAALDEITREDMRHLLVRLRDRHEATVVFVTHSISEAAFLSDRVVVMSPRPGRIATIEPVDLPRPRQPELEDQPDFFTVSGRLRGALRAAGGAA